MDFIEDNRKKEGTVGDKEIEEEKVDPSYRPKSSDKESQSEGGSVVRNEGAAEEPKEGRKRQKKVNKKEPEESARRQGRVHVKYQKTIEVTREALIADCKTAASSFICAKQLGFQTLTTSSSLAMKYMTHVAQKEFGMDLCKEADINAVEKDKQMETMLALTRDMPARKLGTSPAEEPSSSADGESQRKSNSRKRKMTEEKASGSKSTSPSKFNLTIKPAQGFRGRIGRLGGR